MAFNKEWLYLPCNINTDTMKKSKKTTSIANIIERANFLLSLKGDTFDKNFKEGVIAMLEPILHSTGNYNGFHFIDNNDCEINTVGHVSRKYF